MDYKSILSNISIRGRLAYGATCLEYLCKEFSISNSNLDKIINCIWEFTNSNELDQWEKKVLSLLPDTDDEESYATYFGYKNISKENKYTMYNMLEEVIEIGLSNLYAGFKNDLSLNPTLNVIYIIKKKSIKPPSFEYFKKSSINEDRGWGNPVDKDFFKVNS